MTKAAEKLLADVMALDPEVQLEFYEMLREKMEASTDPEYIAAWETEIGDRISAYERGEVKGIPLEEVKKKWIDRQRK